MYKAALFNPENEPENEKNKIDLMFSKFKEKVSKIKEDEYRPCPNSGGNPTRKYNYTRTELGRELYNSTKTLLETINGPSAAQLKGYVFTQYIEAWNLGKCIFDISATDYSKQFAAAQKLSGAIVCYIDNLPMFAGFNLQGALINVHLNLHDHIFIAVNLQGAKFLSPNNDYLALHYSYFINCNLSEAQFNRVNLNQCKFVSCSLENANLTNQVWLSDTRFVDCSIKGTQFNREDQPEEDSIASIGKPPGLVCYKIR